MIVIKIQGGLGNQMFQYAFGTALADKYHDIVKFDLTSFRNNAQRKLELVNFKVNLPEVTANEYCTFFSLKSRLLNKLGLNKNKVHFEKTSNYYETDHNHKINVYYSGYWQSEKYFENISKLLKKEFTLVDNKLPAQYLDIINNHITVAIHIRRGDYLLAGNPQVYHNLTSAYYTKAVNLMESFFPGCQYLVFSDDIDWTIGNFVIPVKWQPVSHIHITDAQMMVLMSKCHHQIIANSTYSWWAAWLNEHPGKRIIAPEKWFANGKDTADLYPANWTII